MFDSKRFINYVDTTTRPDAREKRRQLLSALDGQTCWSINELVDTVHGNSRDKAWCSSALAAGEIVRLENGRLGLPCDLKTAPEVPSAGELERGTLDWLIDQLFACDAHVSMSYMTQTIERAWDRAEGARALGKHWKHNEANDTWYWADKEDE